MSLLTAARVMPVFWISPVLILLALAYASSTLPATPDPYAPALTAAGAWTVAIVAPACAACAAWESGRLRRAEWFALPHVRSTMKIVFATIVPILCVGGVAITVAILSKHLAAEEFVVPDLRIAGGTLFILTAHTLIGFALGKVLPVVIAAPSVLVAGYVWMVMPAALEPLWLRHLTGDLSSCCDIAYDLSLRALAGSTIVAGGMIGTVVILLGRRLKRWHILVASVPTIVGFIGGASLVNDLSYAAVANRDPSALVCADAPLRVCVWPEHDERLDESAAVATKAVSTWQQFGIDTPKEFSEGNRSMLSPDSRTFGIWSGAQRSEILASLAYAILPSPPDCAVTGTAPYPAGAIGPYIHLWLIDITGMSSAHVRDSFPPEIVSAVDAVQTLPIDQQRNWVAQNFAALRSCGVDPQLAPSA